MEKIGVVILNYMTWVETNNCINSILEDKIPGNVQIYVVDNASPNRDEIEIEQFGNQIHFIENECNLGYAAGNNVGITQALKDGCDYILISNNDILFEKGCIGGMVQYLTDNPEYGIVAPCVLDCKRELQRCHFKKKVTYADIWKTQTLARYICRTGVEQVYGKEEFYLHGQDLFAASGCCFMMSSKCARMVTPLDENTFLYEEENILGIRMEHHGIKTRYLPECRVIHNHDQTTRLVKPFALTCWACSEIYYLSKYLLVPRRYLLVLYWYRVCIFLIHGLKDREYRKHWKEFKRKTDSYLQRKYGE